MEQAFGTVRELVFGVGEEESAFVMDGGLEVHFSEAWSKHIFDFVRVGSKVEISGYAYCGMSGEPCIQAQSVLDVSSLRSVNLESPPLSPVASACSPVSPQAGASGPLNSEEILEAEREALFFGLTCASSLSAIESRHPHPYDLSRKAAARSIELAYEGVHRAQALMAYVRIVDLASPDTSHLLKESNLTYAQAIASFQREDFLVACEFAEASIELARSVELLVARTFRIDAGYPTVVAIPPRSRGREGSIYEANNELALVQRMLTRIHWLLRCGTLPAEDREQVRRITAWGDDFCLKGKQFLQSGATSEAAYYLRAAEAVANSAEHICKQDYVMHA
jgi:hypothetical protein